MSACRLAHRIRPAAAGDRNFIVRGWVSEMRRAAYARYVPADVYWPSQHELIARLLDDANVIVACDPDDAHHLYGCTVWSEPPLGPVMHWLYVKGDFRRMGLAGSLLTAAVGDRRPVLCTQASRLFEEKSLIERHGLIYSPYLLLGIAPTGAGARPTQPAPPPEMLTDG